MNKVAQRLRIAREQAGLSQGQVAKMLNFHRPTISEIEAGRRKVNTEELVKFSKIYEVSTDWLINSENENNLDPKIELAARNLAKLNNDDLNKILRLLSSIKKSGSKKSE